MEIKWWNTFEILSLLVVIIAGRYFIFKKIFNFWKNDNQRFFDIEWDINEFLSIYQKLFTSKNYIKQSKINYFKNKYDNISIELKKIWKRIPKDYREKVNDFSEKYNSLEVSRNKHNEDYVDNLKTDVWPELKEIFGKPFENSQLEAIFHDEDSNLVIAWAWTWKTHTLLWKAVFLTKKMNIPEDKVLIMSFTNKTVNEVKERMGKYGIENIEVKTFHWLWNKILKDHEWSKQILDPDKNDKTKIIEEIFNTLLESNEDFKQIIINYFLYYLKPYKTMEDFHNIQEYYRYMKDTRPFTIKKVNVKSYQEAEIANFLTLNWIDYEYEKEYEHDNKDQYWRKIHYKPDFYLPQYDIYIEHFAINQNHISHFWKKYIHSIKRKRDLHKSKNTKLIETFSYEFNNWKFWETFKNKLISAWVELSKIDNDEVLKELSISPEFKLFSRLVWTFLWLFKSNQESYQNLYTKQKELRNIKFLEIFRIIYDQYEKRLKSEDKIDFDDMINKATEHYSKKNDDLDEYKYILIDEFQDISIWRYKLIKTILEKNKGCWLFCVWDDWQSIFRFSWSDLSIFTDFSKYFWYTKTIVLDKCFRFWKHLSDITWKFIMKNTRQIKKSLKWKDDIEKPISVIFYNDNEDKEDKLKEIIKEIQKIDSSKDKTLKFLSRYTDSYFPVSEELKPNIKKLFNEWWVEFKLTCHKAKWLESDFIILNSLEDNFKWFPCKISDDPVLRMVLNIQWEIEYAEERRLFYVATTRSKIKTYLFAHAKYPSIFVEELIKDNKNNIEIIWESYITKTSDKTCSRCWWKTYIKTTKEWKDFYSCENRPYCNNKNYIIK